ncbi:mCG145530, partial [Mus musculus]
GLSSELSLDPQFLFAGSGPTVLFHVLLIVYMPHPVIKPPPRFASSFSNFWTSSLLSPMTLLPMYKLGILFLKPTPTSTHLGWNRPPSHHGSETKPTCCLSKLPMGFSLFLELTCVNVEHNCSLVS